MGGRIVRGGRGLRGATVVRAGSRRKTATCGCPLAGTLIEVPAAEVCGGVLGEDQSWPPFVVDTPYCTPRGMASGGGVLFYTAAGTAPWGYRNGLTFHPPDEPGNGHLWNNVIYASPGLSVNRCNLLVPVMGGKMGIVSNTQQTTEQINHCTKSSPFSIRGALGITFGNTDFQKLRIQITGTDGFAPQYGPYSLFFSECKMGHEFAPQEWTSGAAIDDLAGWSTSSPRVAAFEKTPGSGTPREGQACGSGTLKCSDEPSIIQNPLGGNWTVPVARVQGVMGRTIQLQCSGVGTWPIYNLAGRQGFYTAYMMLGYVRVDGGEVGGAMFNLWPPPTLPPLGSAACNTTAWTTPVTIPVPAASALFDDLILFATIITGGDGWYPGAGGEGNHSWAGVPVNSIRIDSITIT